MVMNTLMRTITLYAFSILNSTDICRMAPFPTVLNCGMSKFMLAPWIVVMKLPILNLLLIRYLALNLLWASQMLIQIIDMSDLGNTLIILGFNANTMLLKIWLLFKIFSTLSEVIWELVCLDKYGMPMIFRYNLDCSNLGDSTWLVSMHTVLLTYFSIT